MASMTLNINEVSSSGSKPDNNTEVLSISIIVPVYNESKYITGVLDKLLEQNYPKTSFEIIVVDGRSTDGTYELAECYAEKYSNVTLLKNPRRLASAARNIGIRASGGDIILIVDGHCTIRDTQMLTNINCLMQNPEVSGLGRPQPLLHDALSPVQTAIALSRQSRLGHQPDSFVYSDGPQFVPAHSVGVAYRRSVFDKIGLFDESFDACEDCELNSRFDEAGLKCYFSPEIGVNYIPRDTLPKLWKQMVRYGKGRVRLIHKHPGAFSPLLFMPAFFVIGLMAGACLSVLSSFIAMIYVSVLVIYTAMIAVESLRISIHHRFPFGVFLIPLTLFTIHTAAGTGLILETFFGKRHTAKRNESSENKNP
ncbi:MAG: glycosyltransferase family 2 protein [Planctomycetaceae bacterium]|jgi:succinoglycan biosynthesis protein ExoA|nr:glycosyltransferase family 2 protein [Planctomycetaceae bacterium]